MLGQVQQADARDDARWKFEITEEGEIDFEEEMRDASGIGRKKKKVCVHALRTLHSSSSSFVASQTRGVGGRRRERPVSNEVRHLLGRAYMHFVEHEYELAIALFRSIIKIEPATEEAWRTLAQCHKEMGDENSALQLDIMGSLLGSPDVDIWRDLGQRSK